MCGLPCVKGMVGRYGLFNGRIRLGFVFVKTSWVFAIRNEDAIF